MLADNYRSWAFYAMLPFPEEVAADRSPLTPTIVCDTLRQEPVEAETFSGHIFFEVKTLHPTSRIFQRTSLEQMAHDSIIVMRYVAHEEDEI